MKRLSLVTKAMALATLALCHAFPILIRSTPDYEVVITLFAEHSGQACTIAELLPGCVQRLRCSDRKIFASTDGCGQPWIIVEQEILHRLRGCGEPESIKRVPSINREGEKESLVGSSTLFLNETV